MNVLDLFSGVGGFSLGLERAGMKTVAFCEIDKKAQAVLKKHWPDVPIFEDVSTLSAKDLNEPIDVICGGFPCQDISTAGKGAGLAGERSGLWFQFHRLIKEIRPQYAIIENVSALRSRGLDAVLRSLAEIGYDAEWHCIPAAAVGAPHRRDRIWIVAYPSQLQRNGSNDYSRECLESKEAPKLGDGCWSQNLAHPGSKGLEGLRVRASSAGEEFSVPASSGCVVGGFDRSHQWDSEPNVGRVVDGVPGRVDRLKQLGNAVVPQIPELIGRAILEKGQV